MKTSATLVLLMLCLSCFSTSYAKHEAKAGWVYAQYGKHLPSHLVNADNSRIGHHLHICQLYYHGIYPGTWEQGTCRISYGGHEVTRKHYRLLVGHHFHWKKAYKGSHLFGKVHGGKPQGHTLYICRAYAHHRPFIGKVLQGHCHYGNAGREVVTQTYDVLTRSLT